MTVSVCPVCPYCKSMYFSEWKESEIIPGVYFNKCRDCNKWSKHNNENRVQEVLPESDQDDVTGL